MAHGQARTADATALTQVITMTLTRASLWRLMEAKSLLAHAAVAFLCRRLRATSEQIEAIALHTIEVRLARFLLAALALRGQGEAGMQPIALDLGMSQTELGLLLGASRSKVNEAMAALEQVGAVHRSEGRLACNLPALQDVAQSG
jgi:CRP/FNR family cyclic AMP-dependent transcriptional regulator